MKASFRNCRERWVFSICREQDKTADRIGKKMMIWLLHGHLMAQFDCILLCCFWFFTKELCIIIKIKVRECSFENQFTACHYKPGLVCFLPHFSLRVQLFFKRKKLQCYSWWSGIILILEGVFLCTCIFTRYVSSFASSG